MANADLWAGSLIGFREAVEAALVIGVLLTWLVKSERTELKKWLWRGVGVGILASLMTAALFYWLWGGISGFEDNEALFEGILEILAAIILTMVVMHFIKHPTASDLQDWADEAVRKKQGMGLAMITFLCVWREGSETVIFISAGTEGTDGVIGVFIGIAIAALISWAFFTKGININIKKLFKVTNVLLIMFAAGLVAHGIHELQEAGWFPVLYEQIWDMNGILDEKGFIGGILKALFGYNGNPSLLEVSAYLAYLGGIFTYYKKKVGNQTEESAEE